MDPDLDPRVDTLAGVLLGTALGDALGLPHEGLRPARIERRLGAGPLGHALVPRLGRAGADAGSRLRVHWTGLVSDDTEHTALVARALIRSRGQPAGFTRAFAGLLRRWILTLPPGVGLATLRGCLRLLIGIDPARSGVDSAGNAPAMRAAILGVAWHLRGRGADGREGDDLDLVALVRASTRITHTDPRAEDGALLIARLAAQLAAGALDPAILDEVRDPPLRERARAAWVDGVAGLAHDRDRGVTGFVVDTVPAAVACALHHADPRAAIEAAIRLGGDADTSAAIVGALVGARVGARALPTELLAGVRDWPLSTRHLHALARALAHALGQPSAMDPPAPRPHWAAALARNVAVTGLLIGHVLARALGR